MGNTITANVNLDHEVLHKQEAIEAGNSLTGKVIIQVQETLDATNLTLEVNGKEKTVSHRDDMRLQDKHSFFRADVQLYTADKAIKPNTYVFPFSIPLPKSLPSTSSYQDGESKGSFSVEYNLKLKTKTRGKFPNKRTFHVTSATRDAEPVPCLLQPKPINPETLGINGKGSIFLGVRVKDTNVSQGQVLDFALSCRNESTCKIERAVVTLEEECYYTTRSTGGHGKTVLFENPDLKRLPGIRVFGLHSTEKVDSAKADEEVIARRMFKDLKTRGNSLSVTIPKNAKESYSGLVLQISHYLKFTLITKSKEATSPSIRVPIHVCSERPPAVAKGILSSYSDHSSEDRRAYFPLAKPTPEAIVLGRNAGELDNEESFSVPIPLPTTDVSLSCLMEDLAASINAYDFLSERLKDLDWAIFFASLTPDEFGSVIAHVGMEFAQPRVGALLAKNFGGDFTCAHCAAAILNASPVFRCNMVEGLLSYCADLADNNHLIRGQLSDFEQIIVALHALSEDETPDDNNVGPRDRPTSPSTNIPNGIPDDIVIRDSQRESRHPGPSPPPDVPERVASPPSRRAKSLSRNSSLDELPGETKPDTNTIPRKTDVLIDMNDRRTSPKLLRVIEHVVLQDVFPEYSPPVYRHVKKQFDNARFLICPLQDKQDTWREASNLELIEYVGNSFDRLREENLTRDGVQPPDKWNESGRIEKAKWQERLHSGGSEWEVALTIHTYASGFDDETDITMDQGPSPTDICFFKAKHPGNAILVKAIRQAIQQFQGIAWSPPIYRVIKKPLVGRRFFTKVGEKQWREATQLERRENIEKYYEQEYKKTLKAGEKSRLLSPTKSTNGDKVGSRPNKKSEPTTRDIPKKEVDGEVMSPRSKARLAMKTSDRSSRRSLGKDSTRSSSHRSRSSKISAGKSDSGRSLRRSQSAGKFGIKADEAATSSKGEKSSKPGRSSSLGKYSKEQLSRGGTSNDKKSHRRSQSASMSPSPGVNQHRNKNRNTLKAVDPPPVSASETSNDDVQHGEIALNDKKKDKPTLRAKPTRKNSVRKIAKRNMRHPRDMDICYGSENHPGTVTLLEVVTNSLGESQNKEWSPSMYKSIRSQLNGLRFFIRTTRGAPWREATAEERVEKTGELYESIRRRHK